MHAGQRLDLERQDGGQLRLGKAAHIGDGEFGVGTRLRRQLGQCLFALGRRHFENLDVGFVELARIFAHGGVAALAHILEDLRDQRFDRLVVADLIARRRFDVGDTGWCGGGIGHGELGIPIEAGAMDRPRNLSRTGLTLPIAYVCNICQNLFAAARSTSLRVTGHSPRWVVE